MEYLPKIEWDILQEELNLDVDQLQKVELITQGNNLYKDLLSNVEIIKSIQIVRDENYEIVLELCIEDDDLYFINNNFMPELIERVHIETKMAIFCLEGCNALNSHGSVKHYGPIEFKLRIGISKISKFHKNSIKEENSKYIKEWYINSSNNDLIFTRDVQRINKYIKKRNISKVKESDIELDLEWSDSTGSLFIELDDYSFIIEKVLDDFSPNWSKKLSIEYQEDLKIPPSAIRQNIIDILSFLFGRQLIKVGETYYDKDWDIIKKYSFSPSFISPRVNLKKICKQRDSPAIRPAELPEISDAENILSQIINSYLQEDNLNLLSGVIKLLVTSTTIPIENEIVMIGASLDRITDNYPTKKVWMSGNKYKKLIKDEINEIKVKLKEESEQIIKGIENAYQVSGRQHTKLLLNSLNLEIGKIEEKAMSYRNNPAHGHDINKKKLEYSTKVYRSLVNRIILKILGHDRYYDLSTRRELKITDKISNEGYENFKILPKFEPLYPEKSFNQAQIYTDRRGAIIYINKLENEDLHKLFSTADSTFEKKELSNNVWLFTKEDLNNVNKCLHFIELVEFNHTKYVIQVLLQTMYYGNSPRIISTLMIMERFNEINNLTPLKINI